MLHLHDHTLEIDERKTVRKELKQKPSVAQLIKQAAALAGMDESTFINSAAYQKAQEFVEAQFLTRLDDNAFDRFAQAVDGEGKRVEALSEAVEQARELFVEE